MQDNNLKSDSWGVEIGCTVFTFTFLAWCRWRIQPLSSYCRIDFYLACQNRQNIEICQNVVGLSLEHSALTANNKGENEEWCATNLPSFDTCNEINDKLTGKLSVGPEWCRSSSLKRKGVHFVSHLAWDVSTVNVNLGPSDEPMH